MREPEQRPTERDGKHISVGTHDCLCEQRIADESFHTVALSPHASGYLAQTNSQYKKKVIATCHISQ